MSDVSRRGALPDMEKDLFCPLMGPPPKLNYFKVSCLERRRENNCRMRSCPEWQPATLKEVKVEKVVEPKKLKRRANGSYEKRKAKCLECGRVMTIIARGLCGGCRTRLKNAGTLDAKFPSSHPLANRPKDVQEQPEEVPAGSIAEPVKEDEVPVLSPAPLVAAAEGQVILVFGERDQELLSGLMEWAEDERRTIEHQIITILDQANARFPRGVA